MCPYNYRLSEVNVKGATRIIFTALLGKTILLNIDILADKPFQSIQHTFTKEIVCRYF